eukprot:Clim_evm56s128 gene=Clim_evmTU56s128
MAQFIDGAKENDEGLIEAEVFDLLPSFTDFFEFKSQMVSYRKGRKVTKAAENEAQAAGVAGVDAMRPQPKVF